MLRVIIISTTSQLHYQTWKWNLGDLAADIFAYTHYYLSPVAALENASSFNSQQAKLSTSAVVERAFSSPELPKRGSLKLIVSRLIHNGLKWLFSSSDQGFTETSPLITHFPFFFLDRAIPTLICHLKSLYPCSCVLWRKTKATPAKPMWDLKEPFGMAWGM